MKKIQFSIVIIFLFVMMLVGCKSKSISNKELQLDEMGYGGLTIGANAFAEIYSVVEDGIVYANQNNIKYYDFGSGESYILCDKANCTHRSENCTAWYESPYTTTGIALHRGNLYQFKYNDKTNTYDLIMSDITGSNQKKIASLDRGGYQNDSWVLTNIKDVYYAGEMMWMSANWSYVSDVEEKNDVVRWMGIHLSDGTVTTLYELDDDGEYNMEGISERYLVLMKSWSELEFLSEEEFLTQYNQGGFINWVEGGEELYFTYINEWYPNNLKPKYTYLVYDSKENKKSVLESIDSIQLYEDNGNVLANLSRYLFVGEYNGKFLCEDVDYMGNGEIFLWDIEHNEKEKLFGYVNGGTLALETGSVSSSIFEESKFLYCLYNENDKADIYLYDLETRESTKLFEDEKNISFRIIKATSDSFIGKIYTSTGYNVYRILKEDYYAGNLKKAIKLKL